MRLTSKFVGFAEFNRRNSNSANFNDLKALQALAQDGKLWRNGFWGKATAIGTGLMGLSSVPMIAGMVIPDANTRALEKMRREDKIREMKGLKPLTQTNQLIEQRINKDMELMEARKQAVSDALTSAGRTVSEGVSTGIDNIRTINPMKNAILPPILPPN